MSRRRKAPSPEEGAQQERLSQGDGLRAAAITVALFFAVALLIGAGVGAYALFGGGSDAPSGPPRAAIVDQLSLTAPGPEFVEEATALLEAAGYAVDYYRGERVTVDFYRELPSLGHQIVLLRTHVARYEVDGVPTDDTRLFTNEPYTTLDYVKEQKRDLLGIAMYDYGDPEDNEQFFGIPPDFVTRSMRGDFDGATVVLMGCDVLRGEGMARAFVEKGADVVVGWDALVSAQHTDAATLELLREHLFGGLSVQEAATAAMDALGPDPFYDSVLLSYPPEG